MKICYTYLSFIDCYYKEYIEMCKMASAHSMRGVTGMFHTIYVGRFTEEKPLGMWNGNHKLAFNI
jgi:hypothetical protein